MRVTVRTMLLDAPPGRAFAACCALLENPDQRRGILARVCTPSPPRVGSVVTTTVVSRDGAKREQRARVMSLDEPRELAMDSIDTTPRLRTVLQVARAPAGTGSTVSLTSEVGTGVVSGRAGRLLDAVLYGRAQRRAADLTLRRLRELAAEG